MSDEKLTPIDTDRSMRIDERQNRVQPPHNKGKQKKNFKEELIKKEKEVLEKEHQEVKPDTNARYKDGRRI
ncbi:MAG TPA: hypothetical protein PLB12_01615 [Candidatus Goldiibacteriota bacterium]|nr:hypothetical protein [Candidatus Goldiibacteriota bacterium]HPN63854.1 hypothetical protein [Candidatus Goldiibacteriota bacterium]HRQ43029.1 hypothetical protein [Candidatus Goldiibacteriota bacterium]